MSDYYVTITVPTGALLNGILQLFTVLMIIRVWRYIRSIFW